MLAVLTGMIGHGLIAFAQRELPVATIGIIQVAQPAIAVCWSFVVLGRGRSKVAQIPGMVLVIVGLVAFTIDRASVDRRRRRLRWRPTNTGSSRDRRAERAIAAADPRT